MEKTAMLSVIIWDDFEDKTEEKQELYEGVEIDARYLHNDIVSTAFEIFGKNEQLSGSDWTSDESDRSEIPA